MKKFLITLFLCFGNVQAQGDIVYSNNDLNDFVNVLEDAEMLLVHRGGDRVSRLCHLVHGIGKLTKDVACRVDISDSERAQIIQSIDEFRNKVSELNNKSSDNVDEEQARMNAGLTDVLYNVVSIMVNPAKFSVYLMNILSGLGKIASSVLADGKIDRDDWNHLMKAFGSIFTLGHAMELLGAGKKG